MKSIRNKAIGLVYMGSLILCGQQGLAQNRIREYLLIGVEAAEELTAAYTAPATEGLMYGLAGGWYNSAVVRDKWDVELSIVTNGAFVPSDSRSFVIDTGRFDNLQTLNGEARVRVPTILGGSLAPVTLLATVDGEQFEFETPGGLGISDLNLLPNAFLQAKVGLPWATEVGVRIFPKINAGGVDLAMLGLGLQHEVSHWIDFLDKSPIAVSVFTAFTRLGADYQFETGGDVLGENQQITLDMDTWLFELVTSTKFEKLNFYGGFGYVTGKSDTRLRGTYELQTQTPITFTDPFDYQNDVSGVRANLGANLRLGWFGMNMAYTFQGYNNVSLGLNFNIK